MTKLVSPGRSAQTVAGQSSGIAPESAADDDPDMACRFAPGQRVRIRGAEPVGHCRTPRYVRGAVGSIEGQLGGFRNPEDLAYGGSGLPAAKLYWVRLVMADLFEDYAGAGSDTLLVEVYEHWLVPVADGSTAHV